MARVTIYKNSVIATILSILGTILALSGILLLFNSEITVGIVLLVIGVGLMFWASSVSEKKAFNTWLKAAKEKVDIDGTIRASVSGAVQVYNLNPGKRMLRYICKLNPEAGAMIKQRVAENKKAAKEKRS